MEFNHRDLEKLRRDHPYLSRTFRRHWETSLEDYASRLYSKLTRTLETELKESLAEELLSMGLSFETTRAASRQLENKPVLQTSHHITPTNGPTFLALDIISLAGLKNDDFYLVGANSGVAFSNSAWSGALSYGKLSLGQIFKPGSPAFRQAEKAGKERKKHGAADNRVSLISSRQRDGLVHGARIGSFQERLFRQFSPALGALSPPPPPDSPYSHWASRTCAQIQKTILRRPKILIFDINRVISRYLVKVLSARSEHPAEQVIFSASQLDNVNRVFQRPTMFLGSFAGKKSLKTDSLFLEQKGLRSLKSGFHPYDKGSLIQDLKDNKLCPGVFLLFFILRFLNGVRCLGSFNQIEYLENFRQKWELVEVGRPMDLEPDYSKMLTAGRILEGGRPCWPLDLALEGRTLDLQSFSRQKMSRFWSPIVGQLIKQSSTTRL